jgi:hypothetical protein
VTSLVNRLNAPLHAYKSTPDPVSWDTFWKALKQTAQEAAAKHISIATILKSVSGLNELGLRLTESGGLCIVSFSRVPESQQILIEWKEGGGFKSQPAVAKRPIKPNKVKPKLIALPSVTRLQAISFPNTVFLTEARIVSAAASDNHAVAPGSSKFLVLCGADKQGGTAWLQGYRLADGNWVVSSELFAGVPPYLLRNIEGKVVFSGLNLVLASESPGSTSATSSQAASKPVATSSASYKIVLRFCGDHYALETQFGTDASMGIALQFSQAIQTGRVDLVKAWLVDAKLASIPAYLGLYNRPSTAPPFKLVAMTSPISGGSRFRLITYGKDDLILDIGKIKAQWAVKGLFIAAPDDFAKKLTGETVLPNKTISGQSDQAVK